MPTNDPELIRRIRCSIPEIHDASVVRPVRPCRIEPPRPKFLPHAYIVSGSQDKLNPTTMKDANPFSALYGDGTFVYVIDDGIMKSHPEFAGRKIQLIDCTKGINHPLQFSHGTGVASLICGKKLGVARSTTLIDVRLPLQDNNAFCDDVIVNALKQIRQDVKERGRQNRTVVNMSFGQIVNTREKETEIEETIRKMHNEGIAFVAAAGNIKTEDNYFKASQFSPARMDIVCTVGSVSLNGTVNSRSRRSKHRLHKTDYCNSGIPLQESYFSNRGDCVDIFAPGENICTAAMGGGYQLEKGTSFAAPLITGVQLCILSRASSKKVVTPEDLQNMTIDLADKGTVGLCNRHTRMLKYVNGN